MLSGLWPLKSLKFSCFGKDFLNCKVSIQTTAENWVHSCNEGFIHTISQEVFNPLKDSCVLLSLCRRTGSPLASLSFLLLHDRPREHDFLHFRGFCSQPQTFVLLFSWPRMLFPDFHLPKPSLPCSLKTGVDPLRILFLTRRPYLLSVL